MHDSNGKRLNVGDQFLTHRYGIVGVISLKDDILIAAKEVDGRITDSLINYNQENFIKEFPEAIKLRPMKELAKEALAVQNASNLSGVVNSFNIAIREVRAHLEAEGTGGNYNLHRHPVCKLFSDKIASLTGTQNADTVDMFKAYDWCTEAVKE